MLASSGTGAACRRGGDAAHASRCMAGWPHVPLRVWATRLLGAWVRGRLASASATPCPAASKACTWSLVVRWGRLATHGAAAPPDTAQLA
eukprot:10769647-Alexandrium_andersonii.AAC.1